MVKEGEIEKVNTQIRPPVVVILGHVDHGKSSILEAIKDLKITEKEAGGITQHIGAYEIEHQGKKITFIDTPGHEAFSAMRSRGAKVADIAILVVAADDGVKPQTKEAVLLIKKSGIPVIVAINKIDKPTADPIKVKRELAKLDILVESMGGEVPSVETSAKTREGIDELLELILLVAEMEGLQGNRELPGAGVVIEAYLDKRRGPTATLLLKDGILRKGEIIGTRSTIGKVKTLEDFLGRSIEEAFPSQPCVVVGFEKVPQVGEKVRVYPDLWSAEKGLEQGEILSRPREVFFIEPGKKVLNLILKTDVLGSLEPIMGVLKNLPQDKIVLRVLKGEAGEISESDVKLAKSSRAKILGFRVKINPAARGLAEREKVKIMTYDVIYELSQGVRQVMEKMVTAERVRTNLGKMKVLLIFRTEKNRQIVGAKVIEGEAKKGYMVEVLREEQKVGKGRIISLQKNKKDIDKGRKGDECGILYEGSTRVEKGDILVIYSEERKKGEL